MISLPPSVCIDLEGTSVDGRRGFDVLSGLVASALGLDPLCGRRFVVFAARGRIARICSGTAADLHCISSVWSAVASPSRRRSPGAAPTS